jgi:hypothetical protein
MGRVCIKNILHTLHRTVHIKGQRQTVGAIKTGPVYKNTFHVDLYSYTEYHHYLQLYQVIYFIISQLSLKTLIPVPHKSDKYDYLSQVQKLLVHFFWNTAFSLNFLSLDDTISN